MEKFTQIVTMIDDRIWGWPLIIMILGVGLLLTVRLRVQRHIALGFHFLFAKDEGHGEVSSFGALCTALSATIGTGNIVGVATAICAGGPGALFWMEVAAVVGIATKFAECMLSVKYRVIDEEGHVLGGPFYYIERGMGARWKWLGKLFALFGVIAGLMGIGTITQVNGITSAARDFFQPDFTAASGGLTVFGTTYAWSVVIVGLVVTICTALVVVGGLKRISAVSEKVVPFMAILYIGICLILLVCNITRVPEALRQVVVGAFTPGAVAGGIAGISIKTAIQMGVARGIFSNEAGLGSAPIAAAAARSTEPVEQGLVSMLGTFIDTIIVCTMTGLAIVLTGAWNTGTGLEGSQVTTYAFQNGLPFPSAVSAFLLMLCLAIFAFTTILGWDYYSERCLEYLTGSRRLLRAYRWLYILAVLIGPYLTVSAVWKIADIFNALMALPNLVALLVLNGVVAAETRAYFQRRKEKSK